MVCCEVIRVMAPVWSCQSCSHVFHLNCIKKWARSPASQADDGPEGWRCPACQHVALKAPNAYSCFCGKVTNPEFQRTEIPHSCGDMCGKKRGGGECNHPCNILCHPGPCPQCPAFITKSCICGRMSKQVRCSQAGPLLFEEVCGALLNCSKHFCPQVCHSGPCQPCPLHVQQACFCGVVFREVACGTDCGHFDGSGYFSCCKTCGKMLDCRSHRSQQLCHPGQCQSCPLSPKLVRSCSCGQTPLSKLQELGYPERKTCTDPIPSCGKTCNKQLPCGDDEDMVFACEKCCIKKRSCGRHKCGELCYPLNIKTGHRMPIFHKLQRSNIPCHLQDISCGLAGDKLLPCGSHRCKKICHRGECQAEGECKQPCIHPRPSCGHPCAAPCHPGTPCPPTICSAKVALQCACGRKKETLPCADAASSYQRYAAISVASKLSDMQLGDNLFIWLFSHRLECDQECATLERNRWLAEALQTDKSVDTFNTSTSSKYSDSLKEDARGKAVCPNTSLAALVERETVSRAPPPITHIKQHTCKADNSNAGMKQSKEEPTVDYFDVQD
ncbi:transcriptional repressor NF-X1-like [Cyprinus carpio]|uniref:Transcriptional repressor NF-X1-like n=1 Tax=Cyprinus carpio TaxID=7962 RepID=A0A9Q9YBS6_CYPCA|nr:transcriptional repressor NF-X1-like [Cyprinus carpio]